MAVNASNMPRSSIMPQITPDQNGTPPVAPLRTNEQQYYDALKIIARSYQSAEQLRRNAGQYGLSFEEEIEAAYENIQQVAERAIHGKRRPK